MTIKNLLTALKTYKESSTKRRDAYLRDFVPKMIYRTTKTENPETTKRMVSAILGEK
jgi:hypothetical protein